MGLTMLWFRRDLRLDDHPALRQACRLGPVLPVFVLDPALLHHPETAVARVAFLLESLGALDRDLRRRGNRLLVAVGDPVQVLPGLARRWGVAHVLAHTDSERLVGRVRDGRVAAALQRDRIPLHWIEPPGATGALLPPGIWHKHWMAAMAEPILEAPDRLEAPPGLDPDPLPTLERLGLRPDGKPLPPAGTDAALGLLRHFRDGPAARTYYWQLSYPAARVTTGLSPYLKFGVISPRRCVHELRPLALDPDPGRRRSARQLLSRLRWGAGMAQRFRYLPQLEIRPLWRQQDDPDAGRLDGEQEELYAAWREGRTGFPIVDAAARCLLAEGGWRELNFRSRAIAASFLTNLCGLDWRWGALHYMRHLIDGDCAIDHWQWAMQAGATQQGSGSWTRIYHPGQVAVDRCDPQGLFIRRWLPELADLTNDQLGAPPPRSDYPAPVLDYEHARRRRLQRLEQQRQRPAPADPLADLSLLPADLRPFAAERFPGAVLDWAAGASQPLLPAPVDPEGLEGAARRALASWFVAGRAPAPSPRATPSPRRRRGKPPDPNAVQLSLWPSPQD
ncbi:MAG: FAD-binding domain-containing protein [Synechococcaceae cyanobacterium]|nr:FAD-binding domain-containing protein [Synechococcaceae cyanobacterium]